MQVIKCYTWCLLKLAFIVLAFIGYTNAACNVCQANRVACINTTSFHLCFDEMEPNTDTLYHCKDGFFCSDANAICLQSSAQRKPSCGDTSLCNQCRAHDDHLFACISRTTFQMCYGDDHPTSQIGYCPKDYVCDASNNAICVSIKQPHTITCDKQDIPEMTTTSTTTTPTTSTTTTTSTTSSQQPSSSTTPLPTPHYPSTTTTTSTGTSSSTTSSPETTSSTTPSSSVPLSPGQVCEKVKRSGLFPTEPNDPFCSRYIYCLYNNGIARGSEQRCPSGSYYNIEKEQCTLSKPPYCF